MPFVSKKQEAFLKANKPAVAAQFEHHSGKGTRARLNTAAEKMMFGRRSSN